MDVVDPRKLDTAIVYLQRMTEGNNPVNNMPADEDAVINNPNVVRCLFFIKDVLEKVKENGGYIGRKPHRKNDEGKQAYPLEVLQSFQFKGEQSITRVVEQMNSMVDPVLYKKLTFKPIQDWLKQYGYLGEETEEGTGSKRTCLTEKGKQLGIRSERRRDTRGQEYNYITYGKEAQEFIVANIRKILDNEK